MYSQTSLRWKCIPHCWLPNRTDSYYFFFTVYKSTFSPQVRVICPGSYVTNRKLWVWCGQWADLDFFLFSELAERTVRFLNNCSISPTGVCIFKFSLIIRSSIRLVFCFRYVNPNMAVWQNGFVLSAFKKYFICRGRPWRTWKKVINMDLRESEMIKSWPEISRFGNQFLEAVQHMSASKKDVKLNMILMMISFNLILKKTTKKIKLCRRFTQY